MNQNKKPAVRPAGFQETKNTVCGIFPPIVPNPPQKDNPHLRDLRHQAETFLDQAAAARDRAAYMRHFNIYLAILAAETKRGQL